MRRPARSRSDRFRRSPEVDPTPHDEIRRRIADVVRDEWSRVIATLVADLGDLAEAEDAAQDAVEEAVRKWPETGMPDRPGAWLTVVARRRAIDRLRRNATGARKSELAARLHDRTVPDPTAQLEDHLELSIMRDDQLRLIFACCHPALSHEAQIALTLRSVGGLTTAEIARAFVVPEPTIAQRLVRAKRKITRAGIPFTIPPDAELLQRTELVRSVIYLVFNEGYDASTGGDHIRIDLCDEAIRLAELLAELTPDDPESLGLLALLLLTHARHRARVDAFGDVVLLDDQDRSAWDRPMIDRGDAVLDGALRLGRPGPYQLQAAINALHDTVTTADATDWRQIVLLYDRLLAMTGSPIVALNRAVALAMQCGPEAGLAAMDAAGLDESLSGYAHLHSARARLLADVGDVEASAAAYEQALALNDNEAERRLLRRRLHELRSAHLN